MNYTAAVISVYSDWVPISVVKVDIFNQPSKLKATENVPQVWNFEPIENSVAAGFYCMWFIIDLPFKSLLQSLISSIFRDNVYFLINQPPLGLVKAPPGLDHDLQLIWTQLWWCSWLQSCDGCMHLASCCPSRSIRQQRAQPLCLEPTVGLAQAEGTHSIKHCSFSPLPLCFHSSRAND